MTVEVLARRADADTRPRLGGRIRAPFDRDGSVYEAIDDDIWRTPLGNGERLGDWAQRSRQIAEPAVLEGLVDAAT
ncbi:MAG: hypothetical protein ACRDRK_25970 [Pseudonocardia sp.]